MLVFHVDRRPTGGQGQPGTPCRVRSGKVLQCREVHDSTGGVDFCCTHIDDRNTTNTELMIGALIIQLALSPDIANAASGRASLKWQGSIRGTVYRRRAGLWVSGLGGLSRPEQLRAGRLIPGKRSRELQGADKRDSDKPFHSGVSKCAEF